MAQIVKTKKHILVKRYKLIKFLSDEGYNNEEIGIMFNLDRSQILRILVAGKKYKGLVKELLSDNEE